MNLFTRKLELMAHKLRSMDLSKKLKTKTYLFVNQAFERLKERVKEDNLNFEDNDLIIQIEKTYSTDFNVGVIGFVLSKGQPVKEMNVIVGNQTVKIKKWLPRPDIASQYPAYKTDGKCGFAVNIPIPRKHVFTFKVNELEPKVVTLAGRKPFDPTGFPNSAHFADFVKIVNERGLKVLELGARQVGNLSRRNLFRDAKQYVGFDIYKDQNVDIVGDAHKLSTYFEPEEFDAVFSDSVFEHLALPWVVSMEINKVLKPGGLVHTSTPSSWPFHERPWDFWRYTDYGHKILFSRPLGFEVIDVGLHSPLQMYLVDVPEEGGSFPEELPFAYSFGNVSILAKKIGPVSSKIKWDVDSSEFIAEGEVYPNPNAPVK